MIIKRLTEMMLEFLLITAGTVICATVYCTIFSQGFLFNVSLLWQFLTLAFICTLPGLVFHSKKELGKKQMKLRIIIHLCILIAIILFLGYYWNWLNAGNILQPIVLIAMFAVVYCMVWYFTYLHDKNTAKRLNEGLQTFKQRSMK